MRLPFLDAFRKRPAAPSPPPPSPSAAVSEPGARRAPARAPGPMRVVAITRVLDEADIVEAFIRHSAAYVDHHVFLDNGSRDGTMEILRALKEEGLGLTVFRNVSVSFSEQIFNTRMYHHAVSAHGADWVLCLDADEFIDDRGLPDGLTGFLERTVADAPDTLSIRLPHINYAWTSQDDADEPVVPLRMRHRGRVTTNTKVFVRGYLPGLTIENGNHFASIDGVRVEGSIVPGLRLAHYPYRSPYQGAVKCAKGWAKILASGPSEVRRESNRHYRASFDLLRDRPQDYFRNPDILEPKAPAGLVADPIAYRGTPLRHTAALDEPMRAMRSMMGYLDELATRHGVLLDELPEARARDEARNGDLVQVL